MKLFVLTVLLSFSAFSQNAVKICSYKDDYSRRSGSRANSADKLCATIFGNKTYETCKIKRSKPKRTEIKFQIFGYNGNKGDILFNKTFALSTFVRHNDSNVRKHDNESQSKVMGLAQELKYRGYCKSIANAN